MYRPPGVMPGGCFVILSGGQMPGVEGPAFLKKGRILRLALLAQNDIKGRAKALPYCVILIFPLLRGLQR